MLVFFSLVLSLYLSVRCIGAVDASEEKVLFVCCKSKVLSHTCHIPFYFFPHSKLLALPFCKCSLRLSLLVGINKRNREDKVTAHFVFFFDSSALS